jgi:hypothetical protein
MRQRFIEQSGMVTGPNGAVPRARQQLFEPKFVRWRGSQKTSRDVSKAMVAIKK